jgi:peroxiredoxin Q/BCP
MAKLEVGRKAPAFNLEATGGRKIALKEFAGKSVALFFYPKDSTSG